MREDEQHMIEEACLPWTPLPERFSGSWQVDVVRLTEDLGPLAIAVAAYAEPTATAPREDAAWRIDFRGCEAHRRWIMGNAGAGPLTYPDHYRKTGIGLWEIAPSRYIVESGASSDYSGQGWYHHYVIVAAIHTVYEIIARDWRCTPLPREWAKPFTGGPFPSW
jgi:hypothetical protein